MDTEKSTNPKETTKGLEIALEVEELEERIAPGISRNHNVTLVRDTEIELKVEELEEKIAPGISVNHNETLVRDSAH